MAVLPGMPVNEALQRRSTQTSRPQITPHPPPSSPAPQHYVALAPQEVYAEPAPSLGDTLRPLWRRRWLLLLAAMIGGGAAFAVLATMPTYYVAEARLLVGVQAPRLLNVEAIIADISPDAERVQNESFILQSRAIAQQVITDLRLADDPSFDAAPRFAVLWSRLTASLDGRLPDWMPDWLKGKERDAISSHATDVQRENRLVGLLLSRLDVATLARSHVLSIKAEAATPEQAALIANAFAEKYLNFQRAEKIKTMDRVDQFLMERVRELRGQVEQAEKAVEDYRRKHGLFKSGTGSVTTQQLTELNTQLIAAQSVKIEAESRAKEAQALSRGGLNSDSVPEVLRSPLITALKQQQADADRRVSEIAASHGAGHQSLRDAKAQANSIAARLNTEVTRTIEGLTRDAKAAAVRYATLLETFDRLKAQMGDVNERSIELEALEREAVVYRNILEAMLNRAKQHFGTAEVLQANAKLISPAVPVDLPSFPPRRPLLLGGALVGLLIAITLCLALEANDRTVRRSDQLEALTGIPTLTLVPQVRSRTAHLHVLRKPLSAYAEALRRLSIGVELSELEASPKVLLFTSANASEGKSVMVSSLARLLARAGKRVVVVDCDWRKPRLHQLFRCGNHQGLSDLLTAGESTANYTIHTDVASGVDVVPSGPANSRTPSLLGSARMADILQIFAADYDYVLLDSGPVLVVADALALSRIVDKVVFVVRWGHTRKEAAAEGLKQLLDVQANIAGVAFSRVQPKHYRLSSQVNRTYGRAVRTQYFT